jgi:hypothetical protein
MENSEIKNSAPRWYKIVLGLWGPFSLLGGGAAAYYILEESASRTIIIASVANGVQIILLGLLLNQGLKYYSAKQLAKRFLIAFFLIAIIPIVFMLVDRGGEMSPGVLMLIILLAISLPQIIYTGLYGLVRKIFKSFPYVAFPISVLTHIILFGLIFGFLFQN